MLLRPPRHNGVQRCMSSSVGWVRELMYSIIYLFNSKDVVKIGELQSKVWGYQSELETHTVETHIYRLRKKILQKFNDENFILTNKSGYEIVKKK